MIDLTVLQAADVWFFDIFDTYHAFVAMAVAAAGLLGALGGRSMAVGSLSAYLVFAQFAMKTDDTLMQNVLITTLVLITVGGAFKLWRLEGAGNE